MRDVQVILIIQVFGFLAALVGYSFSAWSKARDRRWALEDEMRREAATLAHRADVMAKLDRVENRADAAYQEANNVNKKIASIGVQMKDGNVLDPQG